MNKTKTRLVLYNLLIFVFSSIVYYFLPNILLLIAIVVLGDVAFFGLAIYSKKLSVIFTKLFRPVLFLSLLQTYLIIFNRPGTIVFLICNFIFISLHSLLIHFEIKPDKPSTFENIITLVLIFLANNLAAIGLVQFSWPVEPVIVSSWLVNFLIILYWTQKISKRAEVIAGIWALICAEILLIMSNWLVLYQPIPRLYISQIGIIITALSYSLGGITIHQKNKDLSRNIAIEYLSVSFFVFIIMVILTRWVPVS